jgi:hypothetical protein
LQSTTAATETKSLVMSPLRKPLENSPGMNKILQLPLIRNCSVTNRLSGKTLTKVELNESWSASLKSDVWSERKDNPFSEDIVLDYFVQMSLV